MFTDMSGQADHGDRWVKLADIIDAEVVATMIGLTHRNSVYTYRGRYTDFPEPLLVHGKCKLWHRDDIAAWVERRRIRPAVDASDGTDGSS